MVKLYDENFSAYIEVNVKDFYCNDFPQFFARTGKDSYVRNWSEPFYFIPEMRKGSQPTDGGNLIIEADEYENFVRREPAAKNTSDGLSARENLFVTCRAGVFGSSTVRQMNFAK